MGLAEYLKHFIGRPYIWAGDGAGAKAGFDCSGLVLEGLWALGILPSKDLTAQGIHDAILDKFGHVVPRMYVSEDDLLFFGKDADHITHVAVAIDVRLMIEAGGGGSKCKTVATSTGFVRVRPIDGRKDLVAVLRVCREN